MTIKQKIEEVILSNIVNPNERKVGLELECFFYDSSLNRIPVNKTNAYSASDFLIDVEKLASGESPQSSYSLEPGGQLEWASSPFIDLHSIYKQMKRHFNRVSAVAKNHSLIHIDYALEPIYHPADIDLIKMNKYQLMNEWFKKSGNHGPWMMRNTTSVQVNIDITSKDEAELLAWLSDAIEPFCALLFANSPFMSGKPAGLNNLRYDIWEDTDKTRCGNLFNHGIKSPNQLLDQFGDLVLKTPTIFIYEDDGSTSKFEGTLGDYFEQLNANNLLEDKHIMAGLHQIFTHTRFKNVLEVRGADRPPRGFEMAPAAFWIGLLSEPLIQSKLKEIFKSFSDDDRVLLNRSARKLDLAQDGPQSKTIGDWMMIICNLALEGLDQRSERLGIENERKYLEPYIKSFSSIGFMSLRTQKLYKESSLDLKTFLKQHYT